MLSRRRFQSLALTVLGLLLIAFGASRLPAAATLFGHEREHRVVVHQERAPTVQVRSTTGRDVLYDETFRVRAGGDLTINLSSENVAVRTGSGDRARVTVEGRGRDAEAEFERRRFSAREQGGDLVVRTDPPRRRGWNNRTNARFQVTVEIPRRYSADIDVGSGNVEVASLDGDLLVDIGSGNLRVADVEGNRIELDTGSGNVQARTLAGDVSIDTGSGNVQVDRVDGPLEADTGSGNIEVGEVRGTADVSTGSGRIAFALDAAHASQLSTGSGSITVAIPRGAGFDVDLDGSSVRIDEALGFSGERERDEARGRLGAGGPTLRADTGSGSIRLEAR
ncbi:MAG: DUF4097 family beta strand repeat-containing protein [Bacteroidota bacterium]